MLGPNERLFILYQYHSEGPVEDNDSALPPLYFAVDKSIPVGEELEIIRQHFISYFKKNPLSEYEPTFNDGFSNVKIDFDGFRKLDPSVVSSNEVDLDEFLIEDISI